MGGDLSAIPNVIWLLLLIVFVINTVIYGRLELSRRQRIKISNREAFILWYIYNMMIAVSLLYTGGYYFNG